jgi:TolA-binding protein
MSLAQTPFTSSSAVSEYERGMEMFTKEKYASAIRLFDDFLAGGSATAQQKSDAQYYSALSAIYLFNPDAEKRMLDFVGTHSDSPYINDGYLALADNFYQNKNYRKAIVYYELVNRQKLDAGRIDAYFFKLGYSHFMQGDRNRALLMFSEIKDIDTEYTSPALYYFSQLAYEEEMYETAYDGFHRLQEDPTFGEIVPFYIVQILYIRKDYDQIIEMAPALLESAGDERAVELCSFIGDAYYNKGMYADALPYLERFASASRISTRESEYQLAYCYYKTGKIDKAIEGFLDISSRNDALSQNAWFVVGDCYLKQGNKQRAQFGFGQAARMDFDKNIKEEALFNYAKITYETSYSPFGEAIASFQEYIDTYPASPRIQEVYNYLVSTYLQAKNYKAALTSLDKITNKDSKIEEAYQKVAYYRGQELFKNMELVAAMDMFDKSLQYGKYDRLIRAGAIYWRGEAEYRTGDYESAKNDYIEFMGIPGVMALPEYVLVRYNLGSAYYNLGDYSNALIHFRNFESAVAQVNADVMADARNRIADCYYVDLNYRLAIDYYNKVIDYGKVDADYAMYQKGFSTGLMGNQQGKVDALATLIQRYPTSAYVPNAIYERGRAYMALENYRQSEADFQKIINDYPNNQYVPKAMVQLGLLYYNTRENEKAIEVYKQVVEKYKSTEEARYAMTGLKNAYVEMNDVEAYFAYTKTIQGYGDVNQTERDSMLYTSGENLFIAGNYDRAVETFNSYVTEFPQGIFLVNAQYYLAESLREKGDNVGALKQYRSIIDQPDNQFTEESLVAASAIAYGQEEFEEAFGLYNRLETAATNSDNKIIALQGALRAAYELSDADNVIAVTGRIEQAVNVPEELTRQAVFMRAKAYYSMDNLDMALLDFRRNDREVVSAEGSESKFRVAEIQYKTGKIDDAERTVNEFIDMKSPHQFWTARAFILLSDISASKGDMLQARVTLESVRDYYTIDNDGILDEVRSKLNELSE